MSSKIKRVQFVSLKCPDCKGSNHKVVGTRPSATVILRYHKCMDCHPKKNLEASFSSIQTI